MILRFTLLVTLFTCTILLVSKPIMGQNTENSRKYPPCGKASIAITKVPQKRVPFELPANYEPPVANDKLIIFPETIATKKQQKRLLKKRKKRKKRKAQGCKQAAM
jgi:hypothetical protein